MEGLEPPTFWLQTRLSAADLHPEKRNGSFGSRFSLCPTNDQCLCFSHSDSLQSQLYLQVALHLTKSLLHFTYFLH